MGWRVESGWVLDGVRFGLVRVTIKKKNVQNIRYLGADAVEQLAPGHVLQHNVVVIGIVFEKLVHADHVRVLYHA